MKHLLALSLATLLSSHVAAQTAAQEQGFMNVKILKDGKPEASVATIVGNGPGHVQVGNTNGHAELTCLPGGRDLKAVLLFSGYSVDSNKVGKNVTLQVQRWIVEDKDDEIKAIKGNDCQNLGPRQIQVLNNTIQVPYAETASPQSIDLGSGYSLQWSLAIQKL